MSLRTHVWTWWSFTAGKTRETSFSLMSEKKQTKFKKIIISSNNIKPNKQQAAKTALLVLSKLTLRPSVPSCPLSPLSPWGKKKKHKAWADGEWKCRKKRRAVPAATERRAFLTLKPLCPLSPYREQSELWSVNELVKFLLKKYWYLIKCEVVSVF